jgi:hypothetical protein
MNAHAQIRLVGSRLLSRQPGLEILSIRRSTSQLALALPISDTTLFRS